MSRAHEPSAARCACAACAPRAAPAVSRLVAEGSRIDKLYLGKYIPLRERKLLDKLVRTRAVYDDIRNQLLSESEASIKEKPNLKPRKHKARSKDLTGKRSSAIVNLVDMVDKGNVPKDPTDLSECCSCCVCGSYTYHEHEQMRRQTRGRAHKRITETMSRTSMRVQKKIGEAKRGIASRRRSFVHRMSETSGLMRNKIIIARKGKTMSGTSMSIRHRLGEMKRDAKFRPKSIMSEPCTCTQLGEIMKRRSQELMRRLRPQAQYGEQIMFEGLLSKKYSKSKSKIVKKHQGSRLRKSFQKIKKSKTRLIENIGEGAKRVKESQTKLKDYIKAEVRRSRDKMKRAKQKVQVGIKTAVQNSTRELEFPIRKDSIDKYKEKIETKEKFRDFECQHECVPGKCIPEECFKLIKIRKTRNEKNIGVISSVSETAVQVRQNRVANTGTSQRIQKHNSRGMAATEHKEIKSPLTERRINIEIGTKKRVADSTTKAANVKEPLSEKKSVKSMTSLPPVSSKLNAVPEGEQTQKKQQEGMATTDVLKTSRRPEHHQLARENVPTSPYRKKTVKDGSPFSLSIELRKNKELNSQDRHQTHLRKRSLATKVDHDSDHGSQTKPKKLKDAQIGSHALKRCFCTLKLKGKGYIPRLNKLISVTSNGQSQTNKIADNNIKERVQTKAIRARDMGCIICSQEKCDPKECSKKNKNLGVGTKRDTKSTSSITSKTFSTSSKTTLARAKKSINKTQKYRPDHSSKSEQEVGQGKEKQLVRISSTFSFNIEFYKDKPTDEVIVPVPKNRTKREVRKYSKGTHRTNRLRHKHSQISSLSKKSKYTLTKHSLRRCFCTLKLGQSNKGKAKPVSKSRGSDISQRAVQYTPNINRDLVSVNRAIGTDKRNRYQLLPYECEPGVCVTGDCDPYMCPKLIKKTHIRYSSKYSNTDVDNRMNAHANTNYRRTRSTSSFTTRSMPYKVKKIQSSSGPVPHKHKEKVLREMKSSPSSPDRQVVRISSSFSFNIEFSKGKKSSSSPLVDIPVQSSQSTAVTMINKPHIKQKALQYKTGMKHQMSGTMLVKKKHRGSFFAPMKRCFCSLKLQTKERRKNKMPENVSVGTVTPIKKSVEPKNVLFTKATKTKRHKLGPYECEPGVCVPGDCDPYECMRRIQQRQLRESSTVTDKAKMRTARSVTQQRLLRSKGALARTKLKGRKVSTVTQNHRKKLDSYQQPKNLQRRVVRIGSTFSCNIEFCKDKSQSFTSGNNVVSKTRTVRSPKKMKYRGAKIKEAPDYSTKTQDTQDSISQARKGSGIRPMLKRCFCTLELQNEHKKKNNRPPQVIAVSTVTVTKSEMKSQKNLLIDGQQTQPQLGNTCNKISALCDLTSSLGCMSKSSVIFQYKEMQSYFKESNLKSVTSKKLSNSTLKTFYSKINEKHAYSENCIIFCKNYEKLLLRKRKTNMKYDRLCMRNQKSWILSEPHTSPRVCQLSTQNYYAMNMQIPDRKRYRLKPYECEPGKCVPGECDPYECEKLILKRFMKSRMSGTNMKSKSMSSSTTPSTSNSVKLQSNQAKEKVKKMPAGGMVFKTLPNRNQKQAVRVGSSFSFNIEFSKDRSTPTRYIAPRLTPVSHKPNQYTKAPRKKIREQGTVGHVMNYRDQNSQSITETINKGSGMKPIMQRCFCTMKLQKKGKSQKTHHQIAFDRGTATPPNTTKEFINSRTMINAGQNTNAQKPLKLLPYECEPLVCVPGECDPNECLERIKRRNKKLKDFGTDTINYKMSTGSMTGRRQYRTQGKQIESKFRDNQTKSRGTSETKVEKYHEKSSRQAVRIGSSFSFNVEFFKENSQVKPAPREPLPQPARTKVNSDGVQKDYNHKKILQNRGQQDLTLFSSTDSQIGNITRAKSTMTSALLKRCFCTAKLHRKGIATKFISSVHSRASQSISKKPFLERCFCVLRRLKGSKKPNIPKTYSQAGTETSKEPLLLTKNKKVITRPYRNARLDPYECEPGVCVPGECNPYECEKLIKARNPKLHTREAYTDRPRTRSTSSNYSSQTSKARRTQSNFKTTSSTTKAMPTKPARESPLARLVSPNRQVVRIGSTFSFNVEFYKDRSPNTEEVQAAAKAIRHVPPVQKPKKKDMATEKKGLGTADRGSAGSTNMCNRKCQANKAKMQDRRSGVAPIFKRCFCTLKLQKNRKQALHMSSQGTETNTMTEIPTLQTRGVDTGKHWKLKPYECEPGICIPYQCDPFECEKLINKRLLKDTAVMTTRREEKRPYKLLPYECAPGVCVPGQCDPYECDKRIQARNMKLRDSGISTKRHRGKSVSSNIRSINTKARKVQKKGRECRKRSQSVSSKGPRQKKSLDTSTRQSVRIGSGFSFDVEFYKNKSNASSTLGPKNLPINKKSKPRKSMSSSGNQYLANARSKKMQYNRAVLDTESQILARKMRDAGVSPFLRRCFCTLQLHKSLEQQQHKKGGVVDVYMATLLPYECEPGVCIPGECDPYECQKRIKKRLMRSQLSGTERGGRDSSTSSAAGKFKTATCQSPKCSDNHKHQKGTCARAPRGCAAATPAYSSSSSSRQAVRLCSSFKFDVEFYKDRSPKPCKPVCREPYCPPKIRTHTITTKPKHRRTRSRSVTSSELRLQNNRMQTGSRTESKSTGFGPRLKRCFCTLALHKKRQEQPAIRTKSTLRNDDLSDLYSFSRNVGVGTRKRYLFLKQYECEPGVCVPGSCDPYECYERIKRRMRDNGTATDSPSRKYASSITSRDAKYKCANTQCHKARARKERPTMANLTDYTPKPCKNVCADNTRQAVRIGSNFSFSLEFYKDRPATKLPKALYKINTPEPVPKSRRVNRVSSTQRNYKSRPSFAGKSGYDQKCQADCVKNTTRGTTMGAFLKRCFCTLNFHKNNKSAAANPPRIQETRNEKPPDLNREAIVQTKDKYIHKNRAYSLKPYECEPNVCIPGECNPYECEERIRRRNLRRHSRRIGTHRRSQVSVGSMASRFVPRTSRRQQSSDRRACHASRPCQVSKVVEEPRFAHVLEEMKTGIKIGSNVSFDVEFYKDKTYCPRSDVSKKCEDVCSKPKVMKVRPRIMERTSTFSESRPRGMHIGVGSKCDKRTCEAQASGAVMKDRGAGVNNMLRRCFCTLKLHKNPPKVVTVNRLCIEDYNGMAFKQNKKYVTKKQKRNKHINYSKECFCENKSDHSKKGQKYCNEMTTLYPYMPNKFNKNISKTLLRQHIENDISINKNRATSNKKSKHYASQKLLNEKGFYKEREVKSKSNIKSFLQRILHFSFPKKHSASLANVESIGRNTVNYQKDSIIKVKNLRKDTLKLSKSDRRATNILTSPKKTMSLKLTEAQMKKKTNVVNATCHYQNKKNKKKYSHNQCGDTGQGQPQTKFCFDRAIAPLPLQIMCCANCQVLDRRNKSPYESTKVVQMALPKNGKRISAKVGTNTKIYTRNLGVLTQDPESKKKVCCPCTSKGRKTFLSSGDYHLVHRRMDTGKTDGKHPKQNITKKDFKKNKKISSKKNQNNLRTSQGVTGSPGETHEYKQIQGKRNILPGDAYAKKNAKKDHKPTDYSQGDKKTQGSFCSCMRCLSSALEVIKKIKGSENGSVTALGKGKKRGAKFSIKGKEKGKKKFKLLKPKEPCVCGSSICNKEKKMLANWKRSKSKDGTVGRSQRLGGGAPGTYENDKQKSPPCICGSKPCAMESRRERRRKREIEEFQKNIRCACDAELRRREESSKKKLDDMKNKKLAEVKLLKEYKLEDERRKKERKKQDKKKEKEIKRFQKSGDAALLAESVLDVLKLGFTAIGDLSRCIKRAVVNPKRTVRSVKELSSKPSRALSAMGDAMANSGIGSTVHRVRARCKAMRRYKLLVQKLEGNSLTRYLLYMFSKDAKKRIGKARAAHSRRKREPIDFECSLFMASLRRRPCLAVYYNCPAFYPHCLSMLNLWKQFTDIMLVLVAVAVWSPCVVMMEVCRAAVCCFFCTG